MTDGSVPYQGGRVAYRDLGGPQPPVLLLHGLGGNLAHWNLVAPLLHGRYRLVGVDLPSHGASTAPAQYSFDHDLGAVDEVRQRLGLDRPAVVGHSYGGMLAVALGARVPDGYRTAVNIDGLGFAVGTEGTPPPAHPAAEPTVAEPHGLPPSSGDDAWLEDEVRREVAEAAAIGLHLDPDGEMVRRAFPRGADGRWHASPSLARFLEIAGALAELPLAHDYATTTCRTVTLIADHRSSPDEHEAAEARLHVARARELLAGTATEVETIASGHYPHVEMPEEMARRLLPWIDG